DVQELDEVTVTRKGRKSQQELAMEYRVNPDLIRTAFGIIDARIAPGLVRVVSGDDIAPIGLCILDVIRNQFTGVWAVGDCQRGGYVVMRGLGSVSNPRVAIYDVDGQIFSQAPIWLDVNNIKRMAIVSSLTYGARYGSVGGGGVIIINTVGGQAALSKITDLARLRHNYIKESVPGEEELVEDKPVYLNELYRANQLQDAVNVFDKYSNQYSASPYFFMDMYAYFSSRSDGDQMADKILKDNKAKIDGNPVLLKGLAYMLEENGKNKEALEVYKEVFILRPHYSQSYLDLARAYREAGEIGKSANIYARYKYLLEEEFLFRSNEFGKILQHESDNLLSVDGRKIGKRVQNILTDPFVDGTTRVVFEWNDSEAEFELQFVNPGGQYYTWKHTYAASEDRIADEKDKGYSIAEYVIDKNLQGTWTVNAKYLGNKSLTPTYLKVTVYAPYGDRTQRRQVRQYKLFLKDVNQKLFTLSNGSSVVAR
ncbi:MAG: hypothetical protein KJO04_05940, partial [Bacteroidia bacterium]|nr:hypothetical protein [Bacteroidia bacterium]